MIPELEQLGHPRWSVRIPPEIDVPLTDRVGRLLDTSILRRLARLSQLGLVHLVYPGATHSRLEHTLGVYRHSLAMLRGLSEDRQVSRLIGRRGAEAFVLAALLHDAGHWPFCHAMEDMRLDDLPRHENRVAELLRGDELAALMRQDWSCSADDVMSLLLKHPLPDCQLDPSAVSLLASCLSGPIDIDKLDYLVRDSLHAGVPYGRQFDAGRLLSALAIDRGQRRLAITDKGRTAAEMMVFARYVMFSEVYWHRTVRAATAMLQRAVFQLRADLDWQAMLPLDDAAWIERFVQAGQGTAVQSLVDGLFGSRRRLHKPVAEYNVSQGQAVHRQLARRPYWYLVACGDELAKLVSKTTGISLGGSDLLLDAPPVKLEVDINVAVVSPDGVTRPLAAVSPVADALARQQFDDHVKRVRVFASPTCREPIAACLVDDSLIHQAIERTDASIV